jgi:class 3 adenylate cyclase
MRCPHCAFENREGVRFCEECGRGLERGCPACGAAVPPGRKFCGGCGQPLSSDQPAARAPTPDAYTPKHLAEKILTSKSALEGERKQVTALFADLKGSMELLADRDPEEARKLLDPVLERMMEAVHRYEGTVNQVMGDGIMALFGAPLAHEDHAVRACYAAIDLQRAMRRLTDTLRQSHGVTIQARVGLNSGEVVVRAISSDLHMDYTAVGQTTHLAARMEQLATPGATLLTADTLRLAEGYVEVKPLGAMPVKGLPAPVEAYELTGAGPRRSRLSAAAARGLTRFVGRGAELEQLREALARAASGHGQVVALVGEPGVGKSRLVWEVTHSHRTHGWLVLQAGSVSYGKATPYLPVIDLLKGYLQIGDRDEPRAIREKVTGKLLTLDHALEPALLAFLALLDVPVEDRRWEVLSPPERRQRTIDALRRLLQRESQVQPLLVVFEDLHWIDAETQAVLDRLVETPAHGTAPAPRELPPGVPARLEREDLLPAAPAGPARAGECDHAAGDLARERRRPRAPEAAPACADRGQPALPRGERAEPRGRGSARRRARWLPAREGLGDRPRAGDGAGDPGSAHRPAAAGGQGATPNRRGRRHQRPRRSARGSRRADRRRAGR